MPKICIDAGHYGYYNQSPAVKTYYESKAMWTLHLYLKEALEKRGFDVMCTRSDQSKDLALVTRGTKAKGCDLFLSLHSNAVGSDVNEKVDYPRVYYPISGKGKDIAEKLAKCVEITMKTKQAGQIYSRYNSAGNADYYGVIRGAASVGVPGMIIEHSFHTQTAATKWLLVDANLKAMAEAEADVIADHFGMEKTEWYRVQVGAYKEMDNARATLNKVKKAGFDAFITAADGWLKVQTGAFNKKEYATAQAALLKKAGFEAYIAVGS